MDKLTLDTMILRDWVWSEGRTTEKRYGNNDTKRVEIQQQFSEIVILRELGVCELGVTTQLYTDYGETRGKLPEEIEEMIGPYVNIVVPSTITFPLVFPIVFPERNKIEQMFDDLFPDSRPENRNYAKNQKDALQLYAHLISMRDFFITEDTQILKKNDILRVTIEVWAKEVAGAGVVTFFHDPVNAAATVSSLPSNSSILIPYDIQT